jgi:hypothetical protein
MSSRFASSQCHSGERLIVRAVIGVFTSFVVEARFLVPRPRHDAEAITQSYDISTGAIIAA